METNAVGLRSLQLESRYFGKNTKVQTCNTTAAPLDRHVQDLLVQTRLFSKQKCSRDLVMILHFMKHSKMLNEHVSNFRIY